MYTDTQRTCSIPSACYGKILQHEFMATQSCHLYRAKKSVSTRISISIWMLFIYYIRTTTPTPTHRYIGIPLPTDTHREEFTGHTNLLFVQRKEISTYLHVCIYACNYSKKPHTHTHARAHTHRADRHGQGHTRQSHGHQQQPSLDKTKEYQGKTHAYSHIYIHKYILFSFRTCAMKKRLWSDTDLTPRIRLQGNILGYYMCHQVWKFVWG